jgi:hypothetical protein
VPETAIADHEKIELAIRLVPAASVSARLTCADRGPLPGKTAVRVLPVPLDAGEDDLDARKDAAFSRDDIVLTGREKDALFAGPVAAGAYAIAVRPEGFDRWTLFRGTEEPDRAVPVLLETGKTGELGDIELDCSPTVRVEPEILTREAVPDLHDASLTISARRLEPSAGEPAVAATPEGALGGAGAGPGGHPAKRSGAAPGPDAERRSIPAPRQEAHDELIRLRGFPEDRVALSLTIRHPYFVPSTIEVKEAVLVLERGREASLRPPVPSLGGAIQFDATLGGVVAQLTLGADPAAPAVPERHPLDDEERAIGIPPGRYTVELFADAEATRRIALWQDVVIEPRRTVDLRRRANQ